MNANLHLPSRGWSRAEESTKHGSGGERVPRIGLVLSSGGARGLNRRAVALARIMLGITMLKNNLFASGVKLILHGIVSAPSSILLNGPVSNVFGLNSKGSYNAVRGNRNMINKGSFNALTGDNNVVDGSANGIFSCKNKVDGSGNLVLTNKDIGLVQSQISTAFGNINDSFGIQ